MPVTRVSTASALDPGGRSPPPISPGGAGTSEKGGCVPAEVPRFTHRGLVNLRDVAGQLVTQRALVQIQPGLRAAEGRGGSSNRRGAQNLGSLDQVSSFRDGDANEAGDPPSRPAEGVCLSPQPLDRRAHERRQASESSCGRRVPRWQRRPLTSDEPGGIRKGDERP